MASEPRHPISFNLPPCERHFMVHYREGRPVGLVIDGNSYAVNPLKRGRDVREGDHVLIVVEGRTIRRLLCRIGNKSGEGTIEP